MNLYHVDELAGRIEIDIDGDANLTEALNNFIKEYDGEKRRQYLTQKIVRQHLHQVQMKIPDANQRAYLLER